MATVRSATETARSADGTTIACDRSGEGPALVQALPSAGWRCTNPRSSSTAAGHNPRRNAVRAVAAAIPDARHITLDGQDHGVAHEAIAPLLSEFFS